MEDVDDDFGDLYAEVELQASTMINGKSNFSGLHIEQDDNNTSSLDSGPKNFGNSIEEDEAKEGSSAEVNAEREGGLDNGSDSEDDLNIVLNDDGNASAFPVMGNVNLRNGGVDEVEDGGFVVVPDGDGLGKSRKLGDQSLLGDGLELSPNYHGVGKRGNGAKSNYQSQYLQYKYMRPHAASKPTNSKAAGSAGMASYGSTSGRGNWDDDQCHQRMASSSLIVQSGLSFSLPRYRTILDVNIDTFEQKPWRHPGADITDFFNFGFNEESWKDYCNRLEQHLQHTFLLTSTSAHDFLKPKEGYEAGDHEAMPEKVVHIEQQAAVSVEQRITYRQNKQFVMPKGRVIQVEDGILERRPSVDVRRPLERDSDVIQIAVQDSMEDCGSGKEELFHRNFAAHESSENGESEADDDKVASHFSSDGKDEISGEYLEGIVKRSNGSFPERCSQQTIPSKPFSVDSNNHGSGQISDANGHCHQRVSGSSSEGNAETVETSNNRKEKVSRDTCNTALSQGETDSMLREPSQHDWSSSYAGDCFAASRHSGSADPERSPVPLRKSSILVTESRELGAFDYYHLNGCRKSYCSRKKSRDSKYSSRNISPIPWDLKHNSRRVHSVSEMNRHRHHCYDDMSPSANTNRVVDAYYSAVGCGRRDTRLHGHECNDRRDPAYYNEKFAYREVHVAYSDKTNRNHQSSRDEIDRHLTRRWDEGEYYRDQRICREDHEVRGRDCHRYDGELTLIPFICKESRQLGSSYYSRLDKDKVTRWSKKGDKFYFRKGTEEDDTLLDDSVQEIYGYCDKERRYERHLPTTWRGEKSYGRKERKFERPSNHLDDLWSMPNENDYWRFSDHQTLPTHSYREPHNANRGTDFYIISPRGAHDLRFTERNGRRRRLMSEERSRANDWFSSNHHAGDTGYIDYPDGQVSFRRTDWQSKSLHWTEDEYVSRHEDEEFFVEKASSFWGGTSRHRRFDAKQKLIDDEDVEQNRIKLTREGNSSTHIQRGFDNVHSGDHEKTFLKSRDSGGSQLIDGEGKPSGRCSNGESITCNDGPENVDRSNDKIQRFSVYCNESHAEYAGQADNPKVELNQNDEKWLHKFPVTQKNEELDIEEGQIITEVNEKPVDEKYRSEADAGFSNEKRNSVRDESAAAKGKKVSGCDNSRILEMIAKMEKRRERFKAPITLKKGTEVVKPQVEPAVERIENKQQRPLRKRRWGGS